MQKEVNLLTTEAYSDTFTNILASFPYVKISDKNLELLKSKAIARANKEKQSNIKISNSLLLKRSFKRLIYDYISLEIRNNIYTSVDNFIEFCFSSKNKNEIAKEGFSSLAIFVKNLKLDDEIAFLLYLTKNEIIAEQLKLIVESLPSKGAINILNKNYSSLVVNLVSIYADEKEITLTEIEEELEEEKILDDSNVLLGALGEADFIRMYMIEACRYKLLSRQEEQEIGKRAASGDEEAINEFVNHNLKLVISVAKRFLNRGLSMLDLIQEGNIGLMVAARKFDYQRNVKFSTYATYWIRQKIESGICNNGRIVRIPAHQTIGIAKYNKIKESLLTTLGRNPYPNEIATEMGVSLSKIKELEKLSLEIVSLESLTDDGKNDATELKDFIPSEEKGYEEITNSIDREILLEILSRILIPKEFKTLILRYGLVDDTNRTLEEVGNLTNGVSRERVRQIISRAINKIKNSPGTKFLEDYKNDNFKNVKSRCERYIRGNGFIAKYIRSIDKKYYALASNLVEFLWKASPSVIDIYIFFMMSGIITGAKKESIVVSFETGLPQNYIENKYNKFLQKLFNLENFELAIFTNLILTKKDPSLIPEDLVKFRESFLGNIYTFKTGLIASENERNLFEIFIDYLPFQDATILLFLLSNKDFSLVDISLYLKLSVHKLIDIINNNKEIYQKVLDEINLEIRSDNQMSLKLLNKINCLEE